MTRRPEDWTPEQAREGARQIDAAFREAGWPDKTEEVMKEHDERDVSRFVFRPRPDESRERLARAAVVRELAAEWMRAGRLHAPPDDTREDPDPEFWSEVERRCDRGADDGD